MNKRIVEDENLSFLPATLLFADMYDAIRRKYWKLQPTPTPSWRIKKHPYVSPVYGDSRRGLSVDPHPGWHKGYFLSNFIRHYYALNSMGQNVKLDLYEDMIHGSQTGLPDSPEAKLALSKGEVFSVATWAMGRRNTAVARSCISFSVEERRRPRVIVSAKETLTKSPHLTRRHHDRPCGRKEQYNGQTSFASLGFESRKQLTRRERFLQERDQVVPWDRLLAPIAPHYPRAGNGCSPMLLPVMRRSYFPQQWFNRSDPAAEDSLYDIESMRRCVASGLGTTPWLRRVRSSLAIASRSATP